MGIKENKETLYKCVETFNKCTLEWVDTFYSKDLVWKELPTTIFPKGRTGGFKEFREAAEQRLRLFQKNSLTVVKCVAENDYVVFEQDFKGTFATSAGNYKAGDESRLKIVTFFKLKNNLIIEHADFVVPIQ
jgi:hypothetical protein